MKQKTAVIYVTANALATVAMLKPLSTEDRDFMALNQATAIQNSEGYYLCDESVNFRQLPDRAKISAVLSPADEAKYARHVSFPPELRGVIFSGARLPKGLESSLAFWSPLVVTAEHEGAWHCQNLLNSVTEVKGHPQLLSRPCNIQIRRMQWPKLAPTKPICQQ